MVLRAREASAAVSPNSGKGRPLVKRLLWVLVVRWSLDSLVLRLLRCSETVLGILTLAVWVVIRSLEEINFLVEVEEAEEIFLGE
jgi:hypothetical protein